MRLLRHTWERSAAAADPAGSLRGCAASQFASACARPCTSSPNATAEWISSVRMLSPGALNHLSRLRFRITHPNRNRNTTGNRLRASAPNTSLDLMREPSRPLCRSRYSFTAVRTSRTSSVTVRMKMSVETAQNTNVWVGVGGSVLAELEGDLPHHQRQQERQQQPRRRRKRTAYAWYFNYDSLRPSDARRRRRLSTMAGGGFRQWLEAAFDNGWRRPFDNGPRRRLSTMAGGGLSTMAPGGGLSTMAPGGGLSTMAPGGGFRQWLEAGFRQWPPEAGFRQWPPEAGFQ